MLLASKRLKRILVEAKLMKKSTPKPSVLDDPNFRTLFVAGLLDKKFPELQKAVPAELMEAARRGEPWVWADLIEQNPELFREFPLNKMEDLAFEYLLASPPPNSELGRSEPVGSSSSDTSV
jgi:hypothetical protein